MTTVSCIIPKITNPLGKHWEQPKVENILIDEHTAIMDESSFNMLHDYSTSTPSALYIGKMWKSKHIDGWFLRWVTEDKDSNCVLIQARKIILL